MKAKWFILIVALVLAACTASGGEEEPAAVATTEAVPPTAAPAAPVEPTTSADVSDVPIFEGAENYKATGDGSYISYEVPDTTVDVVTIFYQEQLAANGWEIMNKKDSGFGGSITMLRSKPDKNITVAIDTNVVNNGVRVLITIIPK